MGMLSLKALCLSEIVENFDRLNQAYCSENAQLKRNFEFLQRVYSREIMCMLYRADNVKEEYVSFLLNPYLKELDLQKFLHCNWEFIREKITQVGHGIQKLIMSEDCAKELLSSADNLMNHVPNLQTLHLHHICTDEHLKVLGKCCPNITELEINDSVEVSDEGIKDLFFRDENGIFAHSTLQVLNLDGTRVNDEGVAFLLENIPSLQVIIYPHLPRLLYSMHKKDLDRNTLHKAKTYNIRHLDLMCLSQSVVIRDILSISIKVCPHIKTLHFPAMKQEELDLCCKFTELENVLFENQMISSMEDGDITNFLKVRGLGLTTLKLRGFKILLSDLAKYCPRLTTLKLSNSAFLSEKNVSISLRNLQEFILCGADFTNEVAITVAKSILTSSPALEKLSFLHCEIFNEQINSEILSCCTQCCIKHLDFTGSDVEFSLLHNILFACTTLECLAIDNCINISSENVQILCDVASTLKNRPQVVSLEYYGSDYSYSDYDLFDPYDDGFDFYDSYDEDDDEDIYDDYYDGAYDPDDDIDDAYNI